MGLVAKGELSEIKRFDIYTVSVFYKQPNPMELKIKVADNRTFQPCIVDANCL
jgi:hypothetical protein